MGLQVYYGGTFDPVHLGHLAIARAAHDELQATVHLVPAADPPHRPAPGATAQQRSWMLRCALADAPGLRLDLRELERAARHPGVPSYSVDTLEALRAEHGQAQPLAWLIGADSLLSLASWHRWQDLFSLAHFVVAERPGSALPDRLEGTLGQVLEGRWTEQVHDLRSAPAGRIFRLRQPLRPESASEVRQAVASGAPWRHLVPPAVADYIQAQQLYGVRRDEWRPPPSNV